MKSLFGHITSLPKYTKIVLVGRVITLGIKNKLTWYILLRRITLNKHGTIPAPVKVLV
jgi:hypothetical protein